MYSSTQVHECTTSVEDDERDCERKKEREKGRKREPGRRSKHCCCQEVHGYGAASPCVCIAKEREGERDTGTVFAETEEGSCYPLLLRPSPLLAGPMIE